jgi:protein-disulfide isomerase
VGAERAAGGLTPPFLRGHDHALGAGGPVVVVFGDYEDPESAEAWRGIAALRERWDGFTAAWRHLPIGELHPRANGAALASEGAAAQERFWDYHDVLLARQESLSVPDLLTYAGEIGLDVAMLMDDMREGRHAERVLDDVRSAVSSGVRATPGVFVEGIALGGWDAELVEGALRAAA